MVADEAHKVDIVGIATGLKTGHILGLAHDAVVDALACAVWHSMLMAHRRLAANLRTR